MRLPLILAALLCAATPALAQQAAPLDEARAAIADGRLDEADHILAGIREELVDRNDLDFLRGTSALARGEYDRAISAFRAILARDPALHRVRLDLARALFLAGDDGAAEHHFRIAQAADLPPAVQRNVDLFLDQIKRRKRWSIEIALGIAPDTNINAATSAQRVDLYGLPFTLDDNARKQSGIGVAGSLGAAYHLPLDADTRLVMGGRLAGMDYAGDRFDDRTLSAHLGPRFLVGQSTELTTSAIAARRWYGGEGYSTALGAKVEAQTALSPRLLAHGSISLQRLNYDDLPALDGPVATVTAGLTYGLDDVSFIRVDLAVMREMARDEPFRDTQYHAGATYFRELPWGFGVSLGGGVTLARHDAPLPAFATTRADDTWTARMTVSNRRLEVFGFTPVLSVTHSERLSNIDVYDFERDRVEVGITRRF
ncbi:MAG TPA: surface lipoprotein assembly modifier [Candidatus Omnitrophota bacterium]|nr:surface lipoprotein assembly modifier [Candidatus Omnitrophota bacterium]